MSFQHANFKGLASILCGLAVILVAIPAHTQPAGATPREPQKKTVALQRRPVPEKGADREISELIESVMVARLSKELGLNEEETVLMVRRFSEFREQLNDLKRQRQEKLRRLRTVLREEKANEAVEDALQDLIAHDLKMLEFRKKAYQSAAGQLSVKQRAKLYVFISDFEGDMRRLIQKARERRHQPAPPPFRQGPPPPDAPQRSRPPLPPPQAE